MATTWEEIYRDSLSLSGILGEDEEINHTMLESAKVRARNLLDELDGEGIALPLFSTEVFFNTVAGQNQYVLGTGSDLSPANAIRPETIIDAEIRIQPGSQPVYLPLTEITFPEYRRNILVPNTRSQPFNYAFNPKWPQADLYLWPTPSQIWQIRLTTKVKWVDTLGDPNANIFADASLPSGFTNAFTHMLAYRLASWRRLQTPELESKSTQGKYVMMAYTFKQRANKNVGGASAFGWNVTRAGMNPR